MEAAYELHTLSEAHMGVRDEIKESSQYLQTCVYMLFKVWCQQQTQGQKTCPQTDPADTTSSPLSRPHTAVRASDGVHVNVAPMLGATGFHEL